MGVLDTSARPATQYDKLVTDFRNAVIFAVRRGENLEGFLDDDLEEAFSPSELVEIRQEGTRLQEEKWERGRAAVEQRELDKATEAVIREWDAQEKAERLEKARGVARKRLGLK